MARVTVPVRPKDEPLMQLASPQSLGDYWLEGQADIITQAQADQLRADGLAIAELLRAGMDHIVSNPRILKKFIFTDDEKLDEKIRYLAAESWRRSKNKSYLTARLDLACDWNGPAKLLECNFGHMGLVVCSGPAQEFYAQWLKSQPGFEDVASFGSLQTGMVAAFHAVAEELNIPRGSEIAVIGCEDAHTKDKEMVQSARAIAKWVERAGFQPAFMEGSTVNYRNGKMVIDRSIPLTQMSKSLKEGEKPLEFPMPKPIAGALHKEAAVGRGNELEYAQVGLNVTSPYAVLYSDFDDYTESVAESMKPGVTLRDYRRLQEIFQGPFLPAPAKFSKFNMPTPKVQSLQPFWVALMGHKALLAILCELFPDHPNLLPTKFGRLSMNGQKMVAKHVCGLAGIGHRIRASDGTEIASRDDPANQLPAGNSRYSYISQAYADGVDEPTGGFKVVNMFLANWQPAAVGERIAPQPLVGGGGDTKFVPVLVRQASFSQMAQG